MSPLRLPNDDEASTPQVALDKRSATIVANATLSDVRLRSSIKYPR
jgi:hypothetical protein